jgi:hypothetical protein
MGTDMMLRRKVVCTLLLLTLACGLARAQKFSLSVNLLECARLGTLNLDASYAVGRHWSVTAGARYNPFTYRKGEPDRQFQARQQSYSAGVRVWPWHIMSGWWFAAKGRWQEYNMGGILSRTTREGDRFGGGLYAGYALMLAPHLNMEFGVGLWAGMDVYKVYSCPVCGLSLNSGNKFFILPDDVMISLVYVF